MSIAERYSLYGQTALITGAAGLLGLEHALALAESGASLILTDVDTVGLAEAEINIVRVFPGADIVTRPMDVSSLKEIKSVFNEFRDTGIDILVNNAAIDPKVSDESSEEEMSRLENFSLEQWNYQLSVGLTGAFLCSQVFGSAMAAREKGVILNIASDLSVIAPDQRLYREEGIPENRQPVKPVTYSVIKTGLVGLTRYLSSYWAKEGVRVNALSPGGVYAGQSEKFVKRLEALIPMGRMAKLDEYRGVVQFLCSDASKYMTGQNIVMDGGRSVL